MKPADENISIFSLFGPAYVISLRIVSRDKILGFKDTFIIIISTLRV